MAIPTLNQTVKVTYTTQHTSERKRSAVMREWCKLLLHTE